MAMARRSASSPPVLSPLKHLPERGHTLVCYVWDVGILIRPNRLESQLEHFKPQACLTQEPKTETGAHYFLSSTWRPPP